MSGTGKGLDQERGREDLSPPWGRCWGEVSGMEKRSVGAGVRTTLPRDSQYRGQVLGVIWPMWVSPGAPLLGQVWEGLRSWAPASPGPR